LPAPVSTLTWDNVITMSPATAAKYKIRLTEENVQKRTNVRPKVQLLELNIDNRILQGPVLVLPGQPDDTVMVTLGGGRDFGSVAKGIGYNASSLRTAANPWIQQGATVVELKRWQHLALTQDHFPLQADGRAIIRDAALGQYRAMQDFPQQMGHTFDERFSLYEGWDYSKGYQWGMVIDLNTCIGCSACLIACQAENNIPTVGKKEVLNGREMHWIRVDRYFEDIANGETRLHVMPMACVHCENAPCETVCPVGATMHSADGLNMMVYNRCVGTRYCSNNCPYKVRRFNFFKYADHETESVKFQRNPDVTVRARGVMEKCTYCVQRINLARIDAKVNDRKLEDGDVVTACQQACPTKAITFGDINDPHSKVAKLKASGLNYTILEPLNTRARTSYLGKVRNPHPALDPEARKPLSFPHGPGGHHGEHAAKPAAHPIHSDEVTAQPEHGHGH
jgi:molybdopterin-containing oxidoreductase family iron-sulfur binding subunit